MKLLVIVLCLLSERFLTHITSHNRFQWFSNYRDFLHAKFPQLNPVFLFLLAIIPIPLITGFILYWLYGLFFGVIGFILHIVVFYYCLGPENPFYPTRVENNSITDDTSHYLCAVNSQLFSIIFWYILLGPVAILTYRLVYLCRDDIKFGNLAQIVTDVIEWLPARMTALLYLLVGDFQTGIKDYASLFFKAPNDNSRILKSCGLKALGETEPDENLPRSEILVEHAVIVLLVLTAFVTIAARL